VASRLDDDQHPVLDGVDEAVLLIDPTRARPAIHNQAHRENTPADLATPPAAPSWQARRLRVLIGSRSQAADPSSASIEWGRCGRYRGRMRRTSVGSPLVRPSWFERTSGYRQHRQLSVSTPRRNRAAARKDAADRAFARQDRAGAQFRRVGSADVIRAEGSSGSQDRRGRDDARSSDRVLLGERDAAGGPCGASRRRRSRVRCRPGHPRPWKRHAFVQHQRLRRGRSPRPRASGGLRAAGTCSRTRRRQLAADARETPPGELGCDLVQDRRACTPHRSRFSDNDRRPGRPYDFPVRVARFEPQGWATGAGKWS